MVKDINWYFTDEDYDVFSKDRKTKNGIAEKEDREIVRQKLLELNKKLLPELQKRGMDLHNHPNSLRNPNLITSLTYPCEYNKGQVNWLGVRYGKSEKHLSLLNYGLTYKDKDDKLGFQKYACMQVDVCYSGVDVGIYHAVPNDAIDRMYLHDNIDGNADDIINELNKIRFNGYKWSIWNPILKEEVVFDFDNNDPVDFIHWYKHNDINGTYSSMLVHFPRNDERISADKIEETCLNIFSELYGLYKLISWQPNIIKGE